MSAKATTGLMEDQAATFSPSQRLAWQALLRKGFFKLIAGGSLTELDKLAFLARSYSLAGAHCLDIAPLPSVVETVDNTLKQLQSPHPMVMVSIPLDPDPHFRKIELVEDDCITCGVCLPVCPTEAFSFSNKQDLLVSQPLCYGCGRCVPICPTDALKLNPFWEPDVLIQVLSHPRVEAVELHTQQADPVMLTSFLETYGHLLERKLIAYCFRPDQAKSAFWRESLERLSSFAPGRTLIQVDGAPMSGNDSPDASIPAIQAATEVFDALRGSSTLNKLPITISGGINQYTASLLTTNDTAFIAGVGMGTVARKTIWNLEDDTDRAVATAQGLVNGIQYRYNN